MIARIRFCLVSGFFAVWSREFLKPGAVIMRLFLAIYPAVTKSLIQGLSVSDRRFAGVLFENAEPCKTKFQIQF